MKRVLKIFGVFPKKYRKKKKSATNITIAKETGFISYAFAKSNPTIAKAALVMPHPGHGKPVINTAGQEALNKVRVIR